MADTIVIVKNEGLEGNWSHFESVGNRYEISNFFIDLDNGMFQVKEFNGARRTPYSWENISVRDDSGGGTGTPYAPTSINDLVNKLIELKYPAYAYIWQPSGATVLEAGTNVTITGAGTLEDPYIINSSGGGSGFDSLQELYDADPNKLIVTDGTNTATIAPGSLKTEDDSGNYSEQTPLYIQSVDASGNGAALGATSIGVSGADGQAFAANKDGISLTNLANETVNTKISNVTDSYTIEAADLPAGDHTPAYSVNGIPAGTDGNIPLSLVSNPMTAALDADGYDIDNVNQITTNNNILIGQSGPAYQQGQLAYDTTNEALTFYNNDSAVSLQIGQEEWIRVINNTGSTIANGSAVYINGSSSGLPTIALANANSGATTVCAGVATESIANGAIGYVTSIGTVHDLDTSAFSVGAVYLSATTAGALTQTAPLAPNYRYRVGFVTNVNATTGKIHVTPSTAVLGNGTSGQEMRINGSGVQEYYTPRVAHIEFKGSGIAAPADATTYYLSQTNNNAPSTSSGRTIAAPITATSVNWSLNAIQGAAGATGENCTVQIRNVTTGAAAVTLTAAYPVNSATTGTATAAGTTAFSCSQGDKIECMLITPTWATNPSNMVLNFFLTLQN